MAGGPASASTSASPASPQGLPLPRDSRPAMSASSGRGVSHAMHRSLLMLLIMVQAAQVYSAAAAPPDTPGAAAGRGLVHMLRMRKNT